MSYIVHSYNGSPISHFAMTDSLTIGRREGNDIQIDDSTLSGAHAVIERCNDNTIRIRDLDSTNGILFKGKKVLAHTLMAGDIVVLGTHDMQLVNDLPEKLARTTRIRKSWIPGVFFAEE